MLHASLRNELLLDELHGQWCHDPCLRIAPFLDEAVATSLLHGLREQTFTLMANASSSISFQYWNFALRPDDMCDHVLCGFGRFLWTEGTAWLSRLTGLDLGPPPDRLLLSSLYSKGCYLDAHNDYDGARQVAFIIGLTPEPIPRQAGGHLEFLRAADTGVEVAECRPPAWNTLDIFDVRRPVRLHRIPLVDRYVERRAISGWLYRNA